VRAAGKHSRKAAWPLGFLAALIFGTSTAWLAGPHRLLADEAVTNPFLGHSDAIEEGDGIYRSKCIICHGLAGGRGPNLFATQLTDEQFMDVVINGRKGMPAWGLRLSPDDVWKVHAFIKARRGGLGF
jgi:mono/diheme cytochrome c family protein